MPRKRKIRDLKKAYTIGHQVGDDDVWERHARPLTYKVAVDSFGKKFLPDRRRWNPNIAGKFAHHTTLKGTAKELYVNMGVKARGLGTRSRRRSKH